MKQLLSFLAFAMMVLGFVACTADYDEFGASHYKEFKDIVFVEQDGDASVSSDEHVIKVTTVAPPESLETWDSLTLDHFSASNLATLHLVDGKFKEFPSDSAGLDSLAQEVSYEKKNLRSGDKIRIPKSKVVYLMLVAENGDPAIWKLEITIPEASEESSSSSEKTEVKSSSSSKVESSSSKALNMGADILALTFKNQLKRRSSGDTIFVKLDHDQKIESAEVLSYKLSEGARFLQDPRKIDDWTKTQKLEVVAEDGETKRTWFVVVEIADEDEDPASDEKDLISIFAKNQIDDADIDAEKKTVVVHLDNQKEILSVELTAKVSETASQNLKSEALDLRDPVTMTITAEDGSTVDWTISADYQTPAAAPRITAMKIAGNDAVIESEGEEGSEKFFIHYDNLDFLTDLTNLEVSGIELSEDAFVEDLEDGEKYDLSFKKVKVSNGFVDQEYEIRAGYQYPNSDFSTWVKGSDGYQQLDGWDNGNNQYTKNLAARLEDGSRVVDKMTSVDVNAVIFKTFASGNTFVGDFNPKSVPAISMAGYPDGNELIDFGKPFTGRPRYIEFDVKYSGLGDSCDLYIVLENRSAGPNAANKDRKSEDVNKMVASAWYRATTITETPNRPVPDLVSVTPIESSGYSTVRLKLHYGEPLKNSPLFNSSTLNTIATKLEKSEGIDNRLTPIDEFEALALPVTHLRLAMASSADGNHYKGKANATLYVDEIRLIY